MRDPARRHIQLFKFIPIQPGKFLMGSPKDEEGRFEDENQVEVEITKPFEMQETQVTQLQYFSIMETNPSTYEGMQKPVHNISWQDAESFAHKLNELDRDHFYRLPTEAEWEYCCRAKSKHCYSFGSSSDLHDYAHFDSSDGPINVKTKLPNACGLYDMHGNVWEWCLDWYAQLKGGKDPGGPDSGSDRVVRGGSWGHGAQGLRSASRGNDSPGARGGPLGFRLVRIPVSLNSLTLDSSESETREAKVEAILKKLDELKVKILELK